MMSLQIKHIIGWGIAIGSLLASGVAAQHLIKKKSEETLKVDSIIKDSEDKKCLMKKICNTYAC